MHRILQRFFLYISALVVFVLFFNCTAPQINESLRQPEADVIASFQIPVLQTDFQSNAYLVVQVTAADMDTIKESVEISGGVTRISMKVPVGQSRTFSATAYQDTIAVLFGEKTIDLENGKTVELPLKLNFLIPAVTLFPAEVTIAPNDTFRISLKAHNMDSLTIFGAMVKFDPSLLSVKELGRDDRFLQKNGGTVGALRFSSDNVKGEVYIVLGVLPATKAISGDGTIGYIKFQGLLAGTTELQLIVDNKLDPDLGMFDNHASLMISIALGSKVILQ